MKLPIQNQSHLSISPTRNWLSMLSLSALSVGMISFSQSAEALTVTEELNQLTAEFNTLLDQEIDTLNNTLLGSNISLLDVNMLVDLLPNELAETTQSCVQGPFLTPTLAPTSICTNPDEFLLFDEVHPTTFVHSRIADTAVTALAPDVIDQTTNLVIFGDSLSDVGNVFGFSNGTFPFPAAVQGPLAGEPLYAGGSFTNGPIWWQYLTADLGLPDPVAYYADVLAGTFPNTLDQGINFAVGGATTGTNNTGNAQNPPFPIDLPGLQDQIDAFDGLIATTGEADPNALYVVWAGSNNLLGSFLPEDPTNPFGPFSDFTKDTTQPVGDISHAVERLYEQGARNFLVGNAYDLGNTPLGRDLEVLNTPTETVPEPGHFMGTLVAIALFWSYRKCRPRRFQREDFRQKLGSLHKT